MGWSGPGTLIALSLFVVVSVALLTVLQLRAAIDGNTGTGDPARLFRG